MPEDQRLPSRAADVLRDHLLLQVAEENAAMREDDVVRRLEAACGVMGKIDLHLVSGRVVSTSLDRSGIVKNSAFDKPFLVASLDGDPLPLSDFGRVITCMSGQKFGSSSRGSAILTLSEDGGEIHTRLLLSASINSEGEFRRLVIVLGEIQGHSEDDLVQLREGEGEEEFQFTTGNSVTFAPHLLYMDMTTELSETLRVWCPQPTFESLENFKRIPLDPGDFIQFPPLPPSDESRLAIVTALSRPDSQMALFDENRQLKNKRFHLTKIEERLGSVEVTHSAGKMKLCLKEGALVDSSSWGPSWFIALHKKDHYVALNDLCSLECSVSGIRLPPISSGVVWNSQIQSEYFMKTFDTGLVFGDFVEESIPDFGADDFQDMLRRTFHGEKHLFPATSKLKLGAVLLTLDSVGGALNVLCEKPVANVANA